MNAFSFTREPQTPAPGSQAIGLALMQRRMAEQPQAQTPTTMPQLPGNTMRGTVPAVGRRLLQGSPAQQTPSPFAMGGMPFAGAT